MKLLKLFMILLVGGAVYFTACSSDEDFHSASLSITSPEGDIQLFPGDPWSISGTVSDSEGLQSIEVTSTVGVSDNQNLSGTEHTFSYSGNAPQEVGDYSITVDVYNTAGNLSRATRSVSVVPLVPVVELSEPEGSVLADAGEVVVFAGTVSDRDGLSSIRLVTDFGIDETMEISGTSHDFSYDVTMPNEEGAFTVDIIVSNTAGNETTLSTIANVVQGDPCALNPEMTLLVVNVPASTPDNASVEFVGEPTGWGYAPQWVMFKREDGKYCLLVDVEEGKPFKIRRDSQSNPDDNWFAVEKGAAGEEIDNRSFMPNLGGEWEITVESWADQ